MTNNPPAVCARRFQNAQRQRKRLQCQRQKVQNVHFSPGDHKMQTVIYKIKSIKWQLYEIENFYWDQNVWSTSRIRHHEVVATVWFVTSAHDQQNVASQKAQYFLKGSSNKIRAASRLRSRTKKRQKLRYFVCGSHSLWRGKLLHLWRVNKKKKTAKRWFEKLSFGSGFHKWKESIMVAVQTRGNGADPTKKGLTEWNSEKSTSRA